MKKSITLVLVLCLLFSLSLTAFADETDVTVEEETEITDAGTTVYVDNDVILTEGTDILTGVQTFVAGEVTSDTATGLKAALLSVLGSYDAIIVEYEYQNTANDVTTHIREIQPDYVWLCSAGVLALFVFCLFKLGVAVWKR